MSKVNSPFYVIEDFISPAVCERIIRDFALAKGEGQSSYSVDMANSHYSHIITDNLAEHIPAIQEKYQGLAKQPENTRLKQYFENPNNPAELHGCANAKLLRKKWVKVRDSDLVGFIWLKDYNNGVPLDPRFEMYGGKLEFPVYDFSLIPQRGTLVLFPAGPHFITAISPILVGSLELLNFDVKLTNFEDGLWMYQPEKFPGTYREWF